VQPPAAPAAVADRSMCRWQRHRWSS
jgi:hypothetical protein